MKKTAEYYFLQKNTCIKLLAYSGNLQLVSATAFYRLSSLEQLITG